MCTRPVGRAKAKSWRNDEGNKRQGSYREGKVGMRASESWKGGGLSADRSRPRETQSQAQGLVWKRYSAQSRTACGVN